LSSGAVRFSSLQAQFGSVRFSSDSAGFGSLPSGSASESELHSSLITDKAIMLLRFGWDMQGTAYIAL